MIGVRTNYRKPLSMRAVRKSPLDTFRAIHFLLIYLLILTSCIDSMVVDNGGAKYPYDYLCNNRTHFACVCYTGDDSLIPFYPPCNYFFAEQTLPVVRMSIVGVDITDDTKRINGYEPYEHYFKRRIVANLLTRYCTRNGTDPQCTNTPLPINVANVVILKVECDHDDTQQVHPVSVLYYVVARSSKQNALTRSNTIDPGKIIQVIRATLDKKPILLFNAKVEHRVDAISIDDFGTRLGMSNNVNGTSDELDNEDTKNVEEDNFKRNLTFFIVMIILAAIVGIIYVIAIIKAVSDRQKRNGVERAKSQQKEAAASAVTGDSSNYGATRINSSSSIHIPQTILKSSSTGFEFAHVNGGAKKPSVALPIVFISDGGGPIGVRKSSLCKSVPNALNAALGLRNPKKFDDHEALLGASTSDDDEGKKDLRFVKKSKTVHEISTTDDDASQDDMRLTATYQRVDAASSPVDAIFPENELIQKYSDIMDTVRPEIQIDAATDDEEEEEEDDDEEGEGMSNYEPEDEIKIWTTSKLVEENFLHSERSSVNESSFSDDSDEDIEPIAHDDDDQHALLSGTAQYKPLKDSTWSINEFNVNE